MANGNTRLVGIQSSELSNSSRGRSIRPVLVFRRVCALLDMVDVVGIRTKDHLEDPRKISGP